VVRTVLERRAAMAKGTMPLDWASGELLAFATILDDGYPVRVTGQDTERGTFTQRHAVLHDVKTGEQYVALANLSRKQGHCRIINSPLSEMGCLGFEFGYSLDFPDALVAWEAQFGDFVNNAQVIVDQFIAAAEDKWRRLSGLTLLLPHGYEGQGPEHSSARLERFLELCAEDNLQVCYPTTSAQYFHLLRRQVVRPLRKPLVVMTPKSMLRKPEAASPLEDFSRGQFQRVIPHRANIESAKVTRLLLCSGKVYYDVAAGRDARNDDTIAIVRLEQLYPFPKDELLSLLLTMPKLEEVFWVQEEPRNNGAWRYIIQPLQRLLGEIPSRPRYGFIGRVESASPATGFLGTHQYEQQLIVDEATTRGT
jgi:2-oxoglutarate dehydrogenase E1 component